MLHPWINFKWVFSKMTKSMCCLGFLPTLISKVSVTWSFQITLTNHRKLQTCTFSVTFLLPSLFWRRLSSSYIDQWTVKLLYCFSPYYPRNISFLVEFSLENFKQKYIIINHGKKPTLGSWKNWLWVHNNYIAQTDCFLKTKMDLASQQTPSFK